MRKNVRVWLLMAGFSMLAACSKSDNNNGNCTNVPVEKEAPAIESYIKEKNLQNVLKDASGLYYQVLQPGTGAYPTLSSKIFIRYSGQLLNGEVFDKNENESATGWILSTLIPGWQIGIPRINRGGSIRLLVPSSLGYGCRGFGTVIPANSVLVFDVELVDFQ
ncbi:MAG: FKBP-type peptidyl-prolyl cis-trans isomerase [Flavihumibacter sp.]